jgi:alkylhydroperoxidase/carboxymuconolactone decarboxylase family protein YurZ
VETKKDDLSGWTATKQGDDLTKKRGYVFPAFEWLMEQDPEYEQTRRKLMGLVYTPEHPTLAPKYREMVSAVVLAAKAYPSIEPHLRRALSLGLSMQELVEAMEVAAIPGGFPTLHFALPYLIKISDEQKAEGDGKKSKP